jgi:hypothetical protein
MRNLEKIPMPESIKLLSLDPNFNLPIISVVSRSKGIADFKSIDNLRKIALSAYELCSICGQPLNRNFATILATQEQNKTESIHYPNKIESPEAPAHPECLVYASIVCTFLANPNSRYNEGIRKGVKKMEEFKDLLDIIVIYEKCLPKVIDSETGSAVGFTYQGSKKFLVLNKEIDYKINLLESLINETPNRICIDNRSNIINLMNTSNQDFSETVNSGVILLGSAYMEGYDKMFSNGIEHRGLAMSFRKKRTQIANKKFYESSNSKTEYLEVLKNTTEWILTYKGNLPLCVSNWYKKMNKEL